MKISVYRRSRHRRTDVGFLLSEVQELEGSTAPYTTILNMAFFTLPFSKKVVVTPSPSPPYAFLLVILPLQASRGRCCVRKRFRRPLIFIFFVLVTFLARANFS